MKRIKSENRYEDLKELNKYKCEICGPQTGRQANSIIRQKFTCAHCYFIIQQDNLRLFEEGLEVTDDLKVLRSCGRFRCVNKVLTDIKYEDKEFPNPVFCSDKCEQADKKTKDGYLTNMGLNPQSHNI